ncbi:MAG: 1-acyl-sn-glycerol-3-phosphate acyltransferase [Tyzzerella sp.]|uniref:1-acyl-sn-glycerol-3-phosphate acyltransferase n=1 Tax=Candidatus Fimicola merdigallinarum TaxID=2840819 RepID=A0A9D9E0A5_9FIRM|nr:1-acyl-sn-glycerol-3-phosphate acyltransferase [Candidatus Fimicola merdigallinarum]
MFRSIIWYTKFVVMLILKTPELKKAEKILKNEGQEAFDEFCYKITNKWALNRIKDSGAKITVYGNEKIPQDKTVLFVSNHQSNFDIAIFLAFINKNAGFVAKNEMENIPLLSRWMRNIHCVFMDRKDIKKAAKTIIDGISLLKKGYSMVVFPEGTRSKSDKMGEFKAGSFKLATKSKVTVVPVTIDGSYKIMEGNNYIIKPASVDVYVHNPIETANMTKDELTALPERVRLIIEEPIKSKQ